MRKKSNRMLGLAILSGAVLAWSPNLAIAAQQEPAATAASGNIGSGALATEAAANFWTPERMANAKPATPTRSAAPEALEASGSSAAEAAGPRVAVEPTGPVGSDAAEATEEPIPAHAGGVVRPYNNFPDRLNGKVFFTKATGGNFVCSGTAVNSENKSIVWTAGHCVHGGRGGAFHRNWIFVPAYSSTFNGERPYGTFTSRELWTRTEWSSNSNFRQDFGAAVVNRIGGLRMVDRIGGQGITFNQSRFQNWAAYGYPAAAPFNGLSQFVCFSGKQGDDFPPGVGPATIKLHCNMTGGSSGGGWLIRVASNGLGFVNGLNSYKYGSLPDNIFGPYHGNEGLSLYNTVRNRPA